ncbi:MAG: hypothetical protein HC930_13655 [Hydrococcus sp. SU_1_0]|nr:hypothetical protein [Hydrococcus sp. SU_1_0]
MTGNPVADQLAFQEAFNSYAADVSNYLADITPVGQLPSGFGPEHISNAIAANADAFDSYIGTLQRGGEIVDQNINGFIDYIGGVQSLYDPVTGKIIEDIPNDPFTFYDPAAGTVIGSDVSIDDPSLIELQPFDPYFEAFNVDTTFI